jgi:flagella basal body P-ring formation protein FlgA
MAWAELPDLQEDIRIFVVDQLGHVNGKLEVHVGNPTLGNWPPGCSDPHLSLPQGNRLGRILVSVQCGSTSSGEIGWRGLVPVQLTLTMKYFVARHALLREAVLSADDVESREGPVTYLDTVSRLSDGVGKALQQPLAAGQVIRTSGLHEVFVVHRGQSLVVQVQGNGFQISTDGLALGDAAAGQMVQVRTAAGRVLTGLVVGNGVVQVSP